MSRYAVIYDACVLYPAPLRDLLLELATANLFRVQWTKDIQNEWTSNLLKDRPEIDPAKLKRTVELMNRAVPDSLVEGYEHLISAISLPDLNDRHVVAAAIHAKADAIVTFNLIDFPELELAKFNLEAIHPDDFLTYQFDLTDAAVIQAAHRVRCRLKSPALPVADYLATLLAQRLPKTVALLEPFSSVI